MTTLEQAMKEMGDYLGGEREFRGREEKGEFTTLENWSRGDMVGIAQQHRRRNLKVIGNKVEGWMVIEGRQWSSLGALVGQVRHWRIREQEW